MKQFLSSWTLRNNLPDKPLLTALKKEREKGRNDYPISLMWESLLKSFLLGYSSIEAMRRAFPLPPASAFSRFVTSLIAHRPLLEKMHEDLVERHAALHPEFGKILIFDELPLVLPVKRRSDACANNGEKLLSNRLFKWHGYRLHSILDAKTALPLSTTITPASFSGSETILSLFERFLQTHPLNVSYIVGDTSYDDEHLITHLWKEHHIKPLFQLLPTAGSLLSHLSSSKNVVFNNRGEVFCIHPTTRKKQQMIYAGFEEKRSSLKYRCVATNYDSTCTGEKRCRAKSGVRIPLSTDPRLFCPVARSSYKWESLIAHLAARESYHAYLEKSFIPRLPYTRGLDKLSLFSTLAQVLFLAIEKKINAGY